MLDDNIERPSDAATYAEERLVGPQIGKRLSGVKEEEEEYEDDEINNTYEKVRDVPRGDRLANGVHLEEEGEERNNGVDHSLNRTNAFKDGCRSEEEQFIGQREDSMLTNDDQSSMLKLYNLQLRKFDVSKRPEDIPDEDSTINSNSESNLSGTETTTDSRYPTRSNINGDKYEDDLLYERGNVIGQALYKSGDTIGQTSEAVPIPLMNGVRVLNGDSPNISIDTNAYEIPLSREISVCSSAENFVQVFISNS